MILMYHHVCPAAAVPQQQTPLEGWQYCIDPGDFRRQLLLFKREGWAFVSLADYLQQLTDRPLTARIASVTFDDGWRDNWDYAVPVLQELQIPATIFVVSGEMPAVPDNRRMTPDQLRQLAAAGIEVGAHTLTHPNLTTMSAEQLEHELVGSRRDLEAVINRRVRYLAYPGGRFNSDVVTATRAAGFAAACSVIGSGCNSVSSRYWLYRDVFSDQLQTLRDRVNRTPILRRLLHFRAERKAQRSLINIPGYHAPSKKQDSDPQR
jgi:peptidoglycan/xylan/chitin deacetylase (PgdA/CDA1 family)